MALTYETKKMKVHPGERVDRVDFQRAAYEYTNKITNALQERVGMDNKAGVLDGFYVYVHDQDAQPGSITVFNGVALDRTGQLVMNEDQLRRQRQATLITASTTYFIEIEYVTKDTDPGGRAFWDPAVDNGSDPSGDQKPDGAEYYNNIATRIAPDWQIVTPIRTTEFEVDLDPNSTKIPLVKLTTNASGKVVTGATNPGLAFTAFRTVLAEDVAAAQIHAYLVDARVVQAGDDLYVGDGLATEETITVDQVYDRETGWVTFTAGLANDHQAGEIVQVGADLSTYGFVMWREDEAEDKTVNIHPDYRERMFGSNERKGYTYLLNPQQEPSATGFAGRGDVNIKSRRAREYAVEAVIRELKFGNPNIDRMSGPPPGISDSINVGAQVEIVDDFSSTKWYNQSGGVLGARGNTITIGDVTNSWGDINIDGTDVTTGDEALSAALEALGVTYGGTILFKRGTYTFDSLVAINSNVVIRGEGIGNTILLNSVTGAQMFDVGSYNFGLESLSIQQDGAGDYEPLGIVTPGGASPFNYFIRDCDIEGHVHVTPSSAGAYFNESFLEFKNVRIQSDVTSGGSGDEAPLYIGGGSYNLVFENCTFGTAADNNCVYLSVSENPQSDNITFDNCRFIQTYEAGGGVGSAHAMVQIDCSVNKFTFTNCWSLFFNSVAGIKFTANKNYYNIYIDDNYWYTADSVNNLITCPIVSMYSSGGTKTHGSCTNNKAFDACTGSVGLPGAIYWDLNDSVCSGNNIELYGPLIGFANGIVVYNGDGVTIDDNYIFSSHSQDTTLGIYIGSGGANAAGCHVVKNKIHTIGVGIYLDNDHIYNLTMSDNKIQNYTLYGIYHVGYSSKVIYRSHICDNDLGYHTAISTGIGMRLGAIRYSKLNRNYIYCNGESGIYLYSGCTESMICENEIYGPTTYGVRIGQSISSPSDNLIINENSIWGITGSGTTVYGIFVSLTATGGATEANTKIIGNKFRTIGLSASEATAIGIRVGSDGASIIGLDVSHNTFDKFDASGDKMAINHDGLTIQNFTFADNKMQDCDTTASANGVYLIYSRNDLTSGHVHDNQMTNCDGGTAAVLLYTGDLALCSIHDNTMFDVTNTGGVSTNKIIYGTSCTACSVHDNLSNNSDGVTQHGKGLYVFSGALTLSGVHDNIVYAEDATAVALDSNILDFSVLSSNIITGSGAGWLAGIRFDDYSYSIISGNLFTDPDTAILYDSIAGEDNPVLNIFGNVNVAGSYGLYMVDSGGGAKMRGTVVSGNAFYGDSYAVFMAAEDVDYNAITGNFFWGAGAALFIQDASYSAVGGNVFRKTSASGTAAVRFDENAHTSYGLTFVGNTIENTINTGGRSFDMEGSWSAVTGNSFNGDSSSPAASHNVYLASTWSTFSGNTVTEGGSVASIWLDDPCDLVVLTSNIISNTQGTGVYHIKHTPNPTTPSGTCLYVGNIANQFDVDVTSTAQFGNNDFVDGHDTHTMYGAGAYDQSNPLQLIPSGTNYWC